MKGFIFPDKNIYYKINDFQPGRPTLVFIHGLTGSSSAWEKYEDRFENKYNILSFDLRGQGKSVKYKRYEDYEITNFVEDLYQLVVYLRLNGFTLVSHSFGTLIAIGFLSKYQDLVKSTVFLAPNFAVRNRKLARVIAPLFYLTKIIDLLPFSKKAGSQIDYSRYQNTGDWNLRRMRADISNTSWHVYFYCIRQSYKFNAEDFLSKIKIPTLIIHGKKDTVSPVEYCLAWAKEIKNSKLILLDNANHIVVLNNFSEIAQAIENFVE